MIKMVLRPRYYHTVYTSDFGSQEQICREEEDGTERSRIYTALLNNKSDSGLVFFRFGGHSRLWPQNQKKAGPPDPFHENMVRIVYTAKIYGLY